jgi:hypothetical protein
MVFYTQERGLLYMSFSSEQDQLLDTAYNELKMNDRKELYDTYLSPNILQETKKNLEKILFYKKPPTPEEFLDPKNGWLPKDTPETMYPWVRQEFLNILNPDPTKPIIVEYGCTRSGKTYLAVHLMIYVMVYFHHLREPALFFGKSSITELAMYIISFDYDKTKELYLNKIWKILRKSKKFIKLKYKDKVYEEQEKLGRDVIVYSTAATTGEITLASGLQLQLGNDEALTFVGADIVVAFVSELNWWIETDGATEEQIYRLYSDLRERIKATVGYQYLSFMYLDSSANIKDSLIEKHILEELQYRDYVHFTWMQRWNAIPATDKDAPVKWLETGETFKVITGAGNINAKFDAKEKDLENIPTDLIIDVPIDYYDSFKDNLLKSIKDIAGIPTVSENKFITDMLLITDIFDNEALLNIEGSIKSDASEKPEGLLWNVLKDTFFSKTIDGRYKIKRAPNELRYLGIDNSFSSKGNLMGLSLIHKEWSREKNGNIYVADFTMALSPGEKGVSLDAPVWLILDMIAYGSVMIYGIASDSMAAYAGQKQVLNRNNIEMNLQTTDKDLNLYQYFYSCLSNRIVKSGRNIFLKNNLNSLIVTKSDKGKPKIDHIHGIEENKYQGDFEHSRCGVNAKDVSDSLAQAVYLAYSHNDYIPSTNYEEENKRLSSRPEDVQVNVKNAFKQLHKIYTRA